MTTFPGSPRLLKGGIIMRDPETSMVQRIITLQHNPDTLNRTLHAQGIGKSGDRSEVLRLKGCRSRLSSWMQRSTPQTAEACRL